MMTEREREQRLLHILRNPHGWPVEDQRQARHDAADLLELYAALVRIRWDGIELVAGCIDDSDPRITSQRDARPHTWVRDDPTRDHFMHCMHCRANRPVQPSDSDG